MTEIVTIQLDSIVKYRSKAKLEWRTVNRATIVYRGKTYSRAGDFDVEASVLALFAGKNPLFDGQVEVRRGEMPVFAARGIKRALRGFYRTKPGPDVEGEFDETYERGHDGHFKPRQHTGLVD